nr:MAG TPA: hypothetical protein [Caudoviricetes sp.]
MFHFLNKNHPLDRANYNCHLLVNVALLSFLRSRLSFFLREVIVFILLRRKFKILLLFTYHKTSVNTASKNLRNIN